MATVTGLTAARMLQIENASITEAHLSGSNLILTTHGGTPINVGNVKGPKGDPGINGTNGTNGLPGPTGPAGAPAIPKYSNAAARDTANPSPSLGDGAFMLDTGSILYYLTDAIVGTGNHGWYPPLDAAWGEIKDAYKELTSNSIPITGPGNLTGLNFTIKVPAFRKVEFKVSGHISLDAGSSAEARLHICKDSAEVSFGTFWVPTPNRGIFVTHTYEYISDGASHAWNVQISRATGTAHAYMIAASHLKTVFNAVDLGPASS